MEAREIREIMERRRWTPEEFADAMFVSRDTIVRWMATGCPRPGPTRRLKELLHNARKRDSQKESA